MINPNSDSDDDWVIGALTRRVETRDTEFKESQPIEVLKWHLVKTCMAMANLREGGRIVIGVTQRSGNPEPAGLHPDHETGYTQDDLYALVNRYARPPVSLTLRIVDFDEKRFVAIAVRPFDRIPVFCGVDMPPESGKHRLRVGDIPCRTRDVISTNRVHDADLVSELIEIAAEKRAAQIISTAQRIGLVMPAGDSDRFSSERADFGDFG